MRSHFPEVSRPARTLQRGGQGWGLPRSLRHYLTGFFRNSSSMGPFRPNGSSGTMKRFPTKVKGSRLDRDRECMVIRGALHTSQTAETNSTRNFQLPFFKPTSSPFPESSPAAEQN